MRKISVIICMMISCALSAQEKTAGLNYGEVTGNTYKNDYFGITVTIPAGWVNHSPQARQALMEKGKEMLAGDDKNMKAYIDASDQTSVNLLTVSQFPLGSPVPSNPNVILMAEKTDAYEGIKTGSDYLFHVKRIMSMQQKLEYKFNEKITREKISGIDFDILEGGFVIGNITVKQKVYAAIIKGYALSFVCSTIGDDGAAVVVKVVKDVKFEKAALSDQKSTTAPADKDAPKK